MVEGHGFELERTGLREELVPGDRVRDVAGSVRDRHDVLESRQCSADLGDFVAAVHVLVAVDISGDGEKHLRLDLGEAVDDRSVAEFRCATGPHRAEAQRCEVGDGGLADVGEVADDAVTPAYAEALQAGTGAGHLVDQVAARGLARSARLRPLDERDAIRVAPCADRVLGVVERGAGEPHRAGHLGVGQRGRVRAVRPHPEEVPDALPERTEVRDGPGVEVVVSVEPQAALVLEPADIVADERGVAGVRRDGAQHVAVLDVRGHRGPSTGAAIRAARPSRNSRIRAWASSELDATAAMRDSSR